MLKSSSIVLLLAGLAMGGGSLGSGVWKGINRSQYQDSSSGSPLTITVPAGNLSQTFQMGAREEGLDMDKSVFGAAVCSFTVANPDIGTAGATPTTVTIDPTKVYQT
ncbi:MAG: hypothetical protein ABSG04_08725, partial [Verrucomicrobiota bacterium]